MNIHHDLESIKLVAIEQAKDIGYNYNITIVNPNDKGEFDLSAGSTYEILADSYFDNPRPNAIILFKTDDLILEKKETRKIHKMGIVGAGDFGRTIMHMENPSPVIVVDSKVNPFETPEPFMLTNPHSRIKNMDFDVYPGKKFKGGSNFTSKKKKRK